jgi:protease-4
VQVIERRRGGFARGVAVLVTALATLVGVFVTGGLVATLVLIIVGLSMTDTRIQSQTYRDGGGRTVYIIPVMGVIDSSQAWFVRKCVDRVLDDRTARAVVLRVDSPGGGVAPSDQIWYEVGRLKKAGLPVVASYGGVSASGGYYASCGSDFIMAEDTTITGSIGVIAQIMTLEGLMDKVGIEPVTLVATGSPEKSTANDVFRSWTEEDRAHITTMLDAAYETFSQRVKDGRGQVITDPARLAAIADGSTFTARQALSNGLVDGIGYLDDAVTEAEKQAKLGTGSATVRLLTRPPTLLGGGGPFARAPRPDMLDADRVRSFANDLAGVRLMYLMH